MALRTRLDTLHLDVVRPLSSITQFPEGLLPHTVFVEEEDTNGVAYNQYKLTEISPDGSCKLLNQFTMEEEERNLSEINIDWLLTVWGYYCDLSGITEPKTAKNDNPLEQPLRLLLDVATLEIPCFEQSETYSQCNKALEENSQQLYVFLCPLDQYQRNISDDEIIKNWEQYAECDDIERITPDEFACRINDEMFNDQGYWVRFIKM